MEKNEARFALQYDNSLPGFFSLLDFCLSSGLRPRTFIRELPHRPLAKAADQGDLFACAEHECLYGIEETLHVPITNGSARLIESIERSFAPALLDLKYAFLSETPIEAHAVEFARKALEGGGSSMSDESDPDIKAVLTAARKTRKEIHCFLGLLRFEPGSDACFQARFEPDCDIAEELLPHFKRRFGSTLFRIIDMRRDKMVGTGDLRVSASNDGTPDSSDHAVELWKLYYASAENPDRANPKLRLMHMPRRYWRYLPEVEDPHAPSEP
jgi:probable DNA metabolism protein